MKVLMFGWEFPPDISGGLGTACKGITSGLTENKVDILFVAPKLSGREDGGKAVFLSADKIPIEASNDDAGHYATGLLSALNIDSTLIPYTAPVLHTRTDAKKMMTKFTLPVSGQSYSFKGGYGTNLMEEVFRYAYPAVEIAGQHSFDIIHAHDWMTFPAAVAAARKSGKPLVVQIHATEFDRSGENINQDIFQIEKAGMEAADAVIAVSELTKGILIDKYSIPGHKVSVVYNGMPESGFERIVPVVRPFREKIITFVSRITYQKNPENFLCAARRILDKDDNFRFIMAGNGNLLHPMIERAAKLGISSKIHFPGFLDRPAMSRLFSMTDVYVMPSVSEPFGISPLEAIQAGVPVIVSRQSGVQEVLRHALKVNWWDVPKLANAIYGMAKYGAISGLLAEGAHRDVASLKWVSQTAIIKNLYDTVMATR